MTDTRIYVVEDQGGNARLIRATHPANALRHAAKEMFMARVATQDDLIGLLQICQVENAGEAVSTEATE